MNKKQTGIEWADYSWNPYTWDCVRVSPGCKHCYMMEMARKFRKPQTGVPEWRGANAQKELNKIPSGAVIFVNSMSDTYHERVPVAWIHSVHNTAMLHPDKTFLVLTKRVERAYSLRHQLAYPPNLWVGTSVENADYLWRLNYLLRVPAAGHFLSAEPLLGALAGLSWMMKSPHTGNRLGWVIAGGESGGNRRLFDRDWVRHIRDTCLEFGVPFMFKQGSAYAPGQDRELDGRTWDESPFKPVREHVLQPNLF